MPRAVTSRWIAVLGAGLALAVIAPISAQASPVDRGEGDSETDGGVINGGADAGQGIFSKVEYNNSNGSSEPPGAVQSLTDWEPPACWYEPRTAEETREYVENMLQSYAQMPEEDIGDARNDMAAHYIGGDPYTNYNLGKADKGHFYFGVANPTRRDDPAAYSCAGLATWVPDGETPEDQPALSPRLLAEAAYEWLPLPETEVSLNPAEDVPQTVHLPMWIWQDTTNVGEVSATARLERLDMEATTTATPTALTIDPGTEDAIVHPEDGECVINDDGTIGQPYDGESAEEEPPCGVTYTRSTADGEAYELTATITWAVSWTGTGNPDPQPLPDAVLETTHELSVEEVQTIVR